MSIEFSSKAPDPAELVSFASPQSAKRVLKFGSVEDGNEFIVEVHDKYPLMQDIHIEGRRFVEVSVEMFVELMGLAGYVPVLPEGVVVAPINEVEATDAD